MNISLQTRQSLNLLANKMCNLLAYNCIICQQNMQLHNLLAYKMWCLLFFPTKIRDGSRAAATSKMECFVIIVNGFQPLTIITKHSIVDVAAALDPPLENHNHKDD